MKCEDCLPLLEEYFDGEADARTNELLGAHLSKCADCAAALDALRFEQDVYARYDRRLEVTPALWAAVSAGVARGPQPTKDSDAPPFLTRLRYALAATLGALAARPALASTLALLFVGVTAGSLWLALARRHAAENQVTGGQVASVTPDKGLNVKPSPAEQGRSASVAAVTPGEGTDAAGTVAVVTAVRGSLQREPGARVEPARYVAEVGVRSGGRARVLDVQTLVDEPLAPQSAGLVVFKPDNHDAGQDSPLSVNVAGDDRGVLTTEARLSDPEDKEVAQHVERAQVLLRSIKNARPDAGETVNLAYEKKNARRLLADNATLQLDAETRGDKETKQVLDQIEPFLLDIANLGDQPSREEVRSLKERMQKNEIIAALQVY